MLRSAFLGGGSQFASHTATAEQEVILRESPYQKRQQQDIRWSVTVSSQVTEVRDTEELLFSPSLSRWGISQTSSEELETSRGRLGRGVHPAWVSLVSRYAFVTYDVI